MKILPPNIFHEFKNKVLEPSYFPTCPLETLKAHLTSIWLLKSPDAEIIKLTQAFILRTSFLKEPDLLRLEQLASQVKSWDELQICSSYTNITGVFLEYRLTLTTLAENKRTLHFHACYKMQEKACYFISQTAPLIRVVGDPILQKPGLLFPDNATREQQQELAKQIEHAKSILIQSGGAGIAANQCAAIKKPYRFTIVGVFHNIFEHATAVERRYPNTKFPQAMVMVNPEIITVSKETQQFNHACLSVPCANRCTVVSPKEISVRYQDPLDRMHLKEVTLIGVDAVVLWHELTHIIYGKTYMDVTFDELTKENLIEFRKMLRHEIQQRQTKNHAEVPELTVPPFHFSVKINTSGAAELDPKELAKVLPKMTDETLSGLLNQANISLKKKQFIKPDIQQASTRSNFFTKTTNNAVCERGESKSILAKL